MKPLVVTVLLLAPLALLSCGDAGPTSAVSNSKADVQGLLKDLVGALSQKTTPLNSALDANIAASSESPAWPMLIYLAGENRLRRGDTEGAKKAFVSLTSWAASKPPAGPYGDTWGGSGLAAVALWRWLQILERQPALDSAELERVLAVASQLQQTRFFAAMVRPGLLPALPALEEDIADRLAHLAWKQRRPEAISLFMDFLAIHSSADLDPLDRSIYDEALKRGVATADRLDLFRARRILGLAWPRTQKEPAALILRRLWDTPSVPSDVRAEAGLEWANYRRQQSDRQELIRVLTEVMSLAGDQALVERALYARAQVYSRQNRPEDTDAFRSDMADLLKRFPRSRLADNALNQLANDAFFAGDLDNALEYFRQLRAFEGPNDFVDSARYFPALILIARNHEGDLDAADQLLEGYVTNFATGAFRGRALFWRGRIAERTDASDRARAFFKQVVAEVPYDYYGLRARMHAESGVAAAASPIPEINSRARADLRASYRESRPEHDIRGRSPYHERVRLVVGAGLYRSLLEGRVRDRLDNIPLSQLDEEGALPGTAMLLAIRQDALAARDSDDGADNWLQLAGFVGQVAGDWLVAFEMTTPSGPTDPARVTALQNDRRYLASAYPSIATVKEVGQLFKSNAWPIQGSASLSESLMYAVVRQESRFYPQAISHAGALGLFQIMPENLKALTTRDRSAAGEKALSNVEYLLDPARNVAFWSNWIQTEHKLTRTDDVVSVLMKHQAGSRNVSRWSDFWRTLGVDRDPEYCIETAWFNETRNFVRWTLRDMSIADASGLFEN